MPLVTDNVNLYHIFLLVRRVNQEATLGKDLLTECKVKMNFESGEVQFEIRGVPVELPMFDQVTSNGKENTNKTGMKGPDGDRGQAETPSKGNVILSAEIWKRN